MRTIIDEANATEMRRRLTIGVVKRGLGKEWEFVFEAQMDIKNNLKKSLNCLCRLFVSSNKYHCVLIYIVV